MIDHFRKINHIVPQVCLSAPMHDSACDIQGFEYDILHFKYGILGFECDI